MKNLILVFILACGFSAAAQSPVWAPTIKTPFRYDRIWVDNFYVGTQLPSLSVADSNRVAIVGGVLYNSFYNSDCSCSQWKVSGGISSVDTDYGITGNGSSGNPVKVDSFSISTIGKLYKVIDSLGQIINEIDPTVSTAYGILGDGSSIDPIRIDSPGIKSFISKVAKDSINFKVVTRGSSGYYPVRFSGDSIYRYPLRDSVGGGIVIFQRPDSSFVFTTPAFLPGGNSYGADTSIGTNDNFALIFETNGQPRGRITREGQFQFGRFSASDSLSYKAQFFGRQRISHDTLTTDGILKIHSSVGTLNNTQVWSSFRRTDGAATWGVDIRGMVDASNSSASSRTVELALVGANNLRINAPTVTATGNFFIDGLFYASSTGINATSAMRLTSTTVLRPGGFEYYTYGQDLSNTSNPSARIDGSGSAEFGGDFAANYSDKEWAAALHVKSTNNKTFYLPVLTTTQMNNISGVKYINIEGTMSGYDGTSTLTWTGGGGSGLTTNLVVSSGRITDVVVTNWGTGYTSAPSAVLGGAGTGAVITARYGQLKAGMQIFNSTEGAVFSYDGSRWQSQRFNGTKYQFWNHDTLSWVDLN